MVAIVWSILLVNRSVSIDCFSTNLIDFVFFHRFHDNFDFVPGTDDFGNSNTAGLDDFFWCAHIRRLVNLTELNLNLIATDEILILVGNYCAKLEVVNIVSRIKQDYVQAHTDGDGHLNPNPAIFPAIR